MVRCYKPAFRHARRQSYSEADLQQAVTSVRKGMSYRTAAKLHNIPRNTLHHNLTQNASSVSSLKFMKMGHPTALLANEESVIAQNLAILADWGCPLTRVDIKIIVKNFLCKNQKNVKQFSNNTPGDDWVSKFTCRHGHLLSQRMCRNTKKGTQISTDVLNKFYDNISVALKGVPPCNIINYNETNFTTDPRKGEMIIRREVKHPPREMNISKTSYSVMFAGTATGKLLPPYVIYQAQHMDRSWTQGGPPACHYNVTKSGWFDSDSFLDWFKSLLLPFCKGLPGHKVVIGDHLSSHLHQEVFELCNANSIRFVFLPPNTTHLIQPLDVVFYAPMKIQWHEILTDWNKSTGKNMMTLPKKSFPLLLSSFLKLLDSHISHNIKAGFAATGIFPLDRERILKKLRCDTSAEDMKRFKQLVSPCESSPIKEVVPDYHSSSKDVDEEDNDWDYITERPTEAVLTNSTCNATSLPEALSNDGHAAVPTYISVPPTAEDSIGAYSCRLCSYTCDSKDLLKVHVEKHEYMETLSCVYCSYQTISDVHFARHLSDHEIERQAVENGTEGKASEDDWQVFYTGPDETDSSDSSNIGVDIPVSDTVAKAIKFKRQASCRSISPISRSSAKKNKLSNAEAIDQQDETEALFCDTMATASVKYGKWRCSACCFTTKFYSEMDEHLMSHYDFEGFSVSLEESAWKTSNDIGEKYFDGVLKNVSKKNADVDPSCRTLIGAGSATAKMWYKKWRCSCCEYCTKERSLMEEHLLTHSSINSQCSRDKRGRHCRVARKLGVF